MTATRFFLLSTALLLTGCPGDEDDTGDTTDTNDTGDTGDTAETGDTGDTGEPVIAFYVADPNDPALGPVAGVTVAVDTTSGNRLEAVSGADGLAVFELDPEEFAGAIGHVDGRSFTWLSRDSSIDGLRKGWAPYVWSWPLSTGVTAAAQGWYSVSGAILHKADEADITLLMTTAGGGYQDIGTFYELFVPGDVDFTMVALDYTEDTNWGDDRVIEHVFHGWVTHEQSAISGPTTVDIDFAFPTAPVAIEGSIAAPDDAVLAEQGAMYIEIWSENAFIGGSPSTSPGADGASYDFAAEYLDLADRTPTTYVSVWAPDGSGSYAVFPGGLPSSGAQDLGLLAPPRRTSPAGSGPFDWDETIVWNAAVEGQVVRFSDELGGVGLAFVGPEETSYTLPPLPSASTTLGPGSIFGRLGGCTSTNEDPQCERSSEGDPFEVLSPFSM